MPFRGLFKPFSQSLFSRYESEEVKRMGRPVTFEFICRSSQRMNKFNSQEMASNGCALARPIHPRWRNAALLLNRLIALLVMTLIGIEAATSAPLVISTKTLPAATVGTFYSQTLAASGGVPPYNWALVSGGFPDGLSLNSGAGQVTGMPTASGSWVYSYPFQVYIRVTDSHGTSTASSFTVSVLPSTTVKYALNVVNGAGGGSFASGVTVPISANPAPSGQVFKKWTGATVANALSPNTTLVMPSVNVTVTANYASLVPPLSLTTTALSNVTVGAAYSQSLLATGGVPPYTWALVSGGFPDGLALDSSGNLSGMPTYSGDWIYSYPFQVYIKVNDSASASVAKAFSLTVVSPPVTNYTLTVIGGSGSGSQAANSTVSISANAAPAGQVFLNWTGAAVANAALANTTLVMPASDTTVTAIYGIPAPPVPQYNLTVVNGSGGGSFPANASVSINANSAPAGQVFQSWSGAVVANPTSANTTLLMPGANVTVTATYGSTALPATIPQPVTGHPRLWITTADLPRLRSWAVASNPIYQQGQIPLLNQTIAYYNNNFFPGGVQNPVNPDLGDTQGYQGLLTEQCALIFALHSLIDPSPANRILHAQRARNLIMVAMNEAAKGALSGAPFRDPLFSVYNRANATSEAWPLVVDWIYNATDGTGQNILTAQDKATIRTVFMRWANECLNASTTGGDHPAPIGTVNSTSLIGGGVHAYRMAANNYYLGHARLLTLMSLSFDPSDDPAINPAAPISLLGNSLRSYIANATGAWLYQEFAMFGDPSVVRSSLGLPASASVGLASGGLPPEGMLYGHSYSFILGQLLAIKTAGFADPTISGPQVALANNAPVWDRFVQGMIGSLIPAAQTFPNYGYMGPVYQMASYGDILRLWITPDFAQPFALLAMLDQQNGDSSRLNAERWFAVNAVEGGANNLISRLQNPWSYGVQDSLLSFLLLDPAAPPATDPRPNSSTAFYDAPAGRLVEHTDWSANGNMFDFRCSWISINHQQADANQFEFYRKGEWLTKGVANYDNNIVGLTTDYHNTLSLQNWCANGTPANLGWWEGPFWANGSQWQLGGNAGDPTAVISTQASYTYTFGDTTALYNKPSVWSPANAALDILHASRSILWLKPDHIVVYDRATSRTAGLFKRFNLALTAAPSLSGNIVTTTTPGGQHLYLTSLLPASPSFKGTPIGNSLNPMAQLEPSTHRITIEDQSNPTDIRFLEVLQGADANTPADPATLFHSSSGTAMDGAVIGKSAVLFIVDATTPFGSASYTVPAAVHDHYVTGCLPGAFYVVTSLANGNGSLITVTPSAGGIQADSAGVLSFSF